ncbi:sensor histidine kinase [Hoyosella subflava]|uniref:histidine kinase n=1 Tax=Hoyosella subflava (strain DSM 45089 / JCM 17490 / NBRC 109087 / DQS3-9A1) TaxID=443218 RepID=F6EMV2_HOYSD|nr:histidine kinase [Hoyosella subflava]AEF42844.1 Signal transduction histidine kinase-like protein [Hoyosella subflava DQS3-9A1]
MRGARITSTIHALLGAALLLPFVLLGWAFAESIRLAEAVNAALLVVIACATAVVAMAIVLAPPVRQLEVTAARLLLGTTLPDVGDPRSWSSRWRGFWWFVLNLAIGAAVTFALLIGVPVATGLLAFPFLDETELRFGAADGAVIEAGGGWSAAWVPVAGVLVAVVTGLLVLAAGALLRRAAPRILGPTAADQLVLAASRERELAAQNELARELHDSIGHALTGILMQATAAGRVVDAGRGADPLVRQALAAIEITGRGALEELDEVLGVLRTGGMGRTQPKTLADVRELAERASATVEFKQRGDVASVPLSISRESFRIVQEALTNATRYGTGWVSLEVAVEDGVAIFVRNRISAAAAPPREGNGLRGMRERVLLLGGRVDAGQHDDEWHLQARIPVDRRQT